MKSIYHVVFFLCFVGGNQVEFVRLARPLNSLRRRYRLLAKRFPRDSQNTQNDVLIGRPQTRQTVRQLYTVRTERYYNGIQVD